MKLMPSVPETPPSHARMERLWAQASITQHSPRLSTETLPEIARRIVQAVEETEACIENDALNFAWDCWPQSDEYSCNSIRTCLFYIAEHPQLLLCPKRQEWLKSVLLRFSDYLSIPQKLWETKFENGKHTIKISKHELVLEKNAIERQRYWGIGFCSSTPKRDKELAQLYWVHASSRLASDIVSINRFCKEWSTQSEFLKTVSFSHDRLGNQFEHLILCALNHVEKIAVPSTLYQDVYSWFDLRIITSGFLKDARIQIKFIHHLSDQEIADFHPKAKRTIILSPASLAEFLEHSFDPELFGCSWSEFLSLLPRPAYSTAALGTQLYYWFADLLTRPRSHPMSPVNEIPFPILLGIHLFVAHSAATILSNISWRQAAIKSAESIRAFSQQSLSNDSGEAAGFSPNQTFTLS
jgi:hypothetical protein